MLTLPQAVHKMTQMPAERLRIRERRVIRIGAAADLNIFHPEQVKDCASYQNPKQTACGKLGAEYTADEGQEFAKRAMLNVLAVLEREIGDLNQVKSAIKILTFVNNCSDFYKQPYVANGGSQLSVFLQLKFRFFPHDKAFRIPVIPSSSSFNITPVLHLLTRCSSFKG